MRNYQREQIAKIRIQDLRLRTFVGINEDEKKNRQDVVINIRIHYHAEKAVSFNAIDEALNYRTITKQVIAHVEGNRFLLLERMTDEVLALVMDDHKVMWADVTIEKPHALRFSDSVSISLSAKREGYAGAEHPH
ncbi:dihydroneopterin triphosphate 2'-epimerase [Litorivicinus sp.]|jgi:D-erythro-7,8-dihydroneopterin triphosphate epimerase|nr:dihydroneopterin triphosphate 2'-epimerase [Litorivicinus sp.]|tara:strand:- start:43418 stop:43822 length:405 start_codon:yes stop_codon:yes gene_type:complete